MESDGEFPQGKSSNRGPSSWRWEVSKASAFTISAQAGAVDTGPESCKLGSVGHISAVHLPPHPPSSGFQPDLINSHRPPPPPPCPPAPHNWVCFFHSHPVLSTNHLFMPSLFCWPHGAHKATYFRRKLLGFKCNRFNIFPSLD